MEFISRLRTGFKQIRKIITYWISAVCILFLLIAFISNASFATRFSIDSIKDVVNKVSSDSYYQIVSTENAYFKLTAPELSTKGILTFNSLLQITTNVVFNDHRSLLGNELPGFNLFDSKILVAGEGTNYTNMPFESSPPDETFAKTSEAVENITPPVTETPPSTETPSLRTNGEVVHLYFTHTRESYLPQLGTTDPNLAQNTQFNVINVGEMLASSLQSKGIGTSIDKTDVVTRLLEKKLKYASSYQESRLLVQEAIANNKNLQYFIDVHRDSQRKKVTTIEKDGLGYAKIAFVIGGENPNYEQNMALANAIHQKLNALQPGLSRGVFAKSGKGTNGKYNQDLSTKAMLIEVGGVDNTVDELNRSMAVFAEAFSEYYWQAEAVQGTNTPSPQ